jgi:hypothetical protein
VRRAARQLMPAAGWRPVKCQKALEGHDHPAHDHEHDDEIVWCSGVRPVQEDHPCLTSISPATAPDPTAQT